MADEQENDVPENGIDQEDPLSEPKPKPKLIRVLTVLAYILSVSMAAILLSIYYVFMWDGQPTLARRTDPSMQHRIGSNGYDYPDAYKDDGDNVTLLNGNDQLVSAKNLSDIESLTTIENFTNSLLGNSSIQEDLNGSDVNIADQNIARNETEVSVLDNSDRNADPLTEIYDIYTTSSAIGSTEDSLTGVNDDVEDPININQLDIRNNLFYRKYFYKKLIMS